jgi:hypothetical protein
MQFENVFEYAKFYHSQGLVCVPIPAREKGPIIKGWNERTLETPIKAEEFVPESNIGILTGKVSEILVLDIDIKDRGLQLFNQLLEENDVNEDDLTRTSTTGSGGKHLFFQYNPVFSRCGARVVTLDGVKIGWDIKSNGGQVVVEPSLHKDTGNMYEFNTHFDNFRDSIKPMPDWLYAILDAGAMTEAGGLMADYEQQQQRVVPQPRADVDHEPVALDKLEQFVSLLGQARWDHYDTWIKIGFVIHRETQGSNEGREMWKRCSRAKYQHYNEREHDRKWRSFGGNCDNPATVGTIKKFAELDAPEQYAMLKGQIRVEKVAQVNEAIVAANPLPPILDPNNKVYFSDIEQQLGENPTLEHVLQVLRQVVAYIRNSGNAFWISKNFDRMMGCPKYVHLKEKKISKSPLGLTKLPLGHNGRLVSLYELMQQHYRVFAFDDRVFWPTRKLDEFYVKSKYFNYFTGFRHRETGQYDQSVVDAIIKHFREVFTAGDDELNEYLLNWHAYIVQCRESDANPEQRERMVKCLVARGDYGSGKSVWFEFFGEKVIGPQYFDQAKVNQLTGNFNSIVENKIFVVINEARNGAFCSPDAEETFKDMISGKMIGIEHKGDDVYTTGNFANFAICCNHQYPIKINPGDRRFVAFDTHNTYKGNTDYWRWAMANLLTDENAAHFYNYLLTRDLSQWKYDDIPNTEARKGIKWDSQPPSIRWLRDYRNQLEDNVEYSVGVDELFAQFVGWRDRNAINVRTSKDSFGKDIRLIVGPSQRRRIEGQQRSVHTFTKAGVLEALNKRLDMNVEDQE